MFSEYLKTYAINLNLFSKMNIILRIHLNSLFRKENLIYKTITSFILQYKILDFILLQEAKKCLTFILINNFHLILG